MKKSTLGFLSIILACLCWASDSYFRYPLIESGLSAPLLVFIEHSILILFFSAHLVSSLKISFKKFDLSLWSSFFVIGALGSAMATVFFSQAMLYLNPSVVILMQKLQPIFALYFARVFLQEKLSASFLFLAALALLGAVMLSFPDLIKIYNLESPWTSTDTQNTLLGYGYTLLSVIIWAAASIFGKKIFNQTSAYFSIQQVMSLRYFFGWIALACFFLFLSFSHEIDLSLLANYKNSTAIVCMVLISGIAGMGFYYQGVKILRPRNIIIAELWYPFTAIMVNKLVLGISLNFWQLLGAAILVLATFSVQNKKLE